MSSNGGASTSSGAPANASAAPPNQEFGTLWIQDQNGVSQMIRVLQAAPTKVSAAASSTSAVATPAVANPPGMMRAIIKTAMPVAVAAPSTAAAPAAGVLPAVRRAVQIQPGGLQVRGSLTSGSGTVIARSGSRAILSGTNRVLTISPQRHALVTRTPLPGSPARRTLVTRRVPVTPRRRVLPSGASAPSSEPVTSASPMEASPALVAALTGQPQPLVIRPATPTPQQQQQQDQPQQQQQQQQQPVRPAFISAILDHSGTRKRQPEQDVWPESKRGRRVEKSSKGLRHFSMKVCEKVRTKGTTTYNEVADELVTEFTEQSCESPSEQQCDQKNIRRRVYDALNVLMAMNIISKEKKEIRWLGLPTNSLQECRNLEREKATRLQRINLKTQQLKDLILQQIAFKNLVERNRKAEADHGPPPSNSTVQLPFIIVSTSKKTVIDCSISNDKMEYLFTFDGTFAIHDDIEILKRMGLALGLEDGTCRPEDVERARTMVPPSLVPYVDQLAREGAGGAAEPELEALHAVSSTLSNNSDRGGSVTPSIDFDTDDDDDGLLEVDDEEEV